MEKKYDRIGLHFKLFSLTVNGIKYYFIGSVQNGGFRYVYRKSEDAVDMFEKLERHAEKYDVCDLPDWED